MAVSKKLVYADMDGFSFEFQWHISFRLPEALSQRAMAAIRVVGTVHDSELTWPQLCPELQQKSSQMIDSQSDQGEITGVLWLMA